MEEALEQTARTTSRQSFLGVLKVRLASELTKKRFARNSALVSQKLMYMYILVIFVFICILSAFF